MLFLRDKKEKPPQMQLGSVLSFLSLLISQISWSSTLSHVISIPISLIAAILILSTVIGWLWSGKDFLFMLEDTVVESQLAFSFSNAFCGLLWGDDMQARILTHLDPDRFLREEGTLWRFLDCFKIVFIASSRTYHIKKVRWKGNSQTDGKTYQINILDFKYTR